MLVLPYPFCFSPWYCVGLSWQVVWKLYLSRWTVLIQDCDKVVDWGQGSWCSYTSPWIACNSWYALEHWVVRSCICCAHFQICKHTSNSHCLLVLMSPAASRENGGIPAGQCPWWRKTSSKNSRAQSKRFLYAVVPWSHAEVVLQRSTRRNSG